MRKGRIKKPDHASRKMQNKSSRRPGFTALVKNYLLRHIQVMFYSIGQLSRTPFSSLMTCAVIGIALALPSTFFTLLNNVQTLSLGWDGNAQISLFMKYDISNSSAQKLATKLRMRPEIKTTEFISREQALEEFRAYSGFGEVLDVLEKNPLPAVIVVTPASTLDTPNHIESLLASLKNLRQVDLAQLDLEWVKRLHALLETGQRGVTILAILLGLSVLLVVGNTIRLGIENRRDEIIITKLIGGTNRFIRRPFLYTGIWYGLIGGLLAWSAVFITMMLLKAPINRLADLYYSQFTLALPSLENALLLLFTGALLGLAGSWIAVGRHLQDIEPA